MELERIQTSDEIRLGELLAILWNSKLLIAAVTAVCVVLGVTAFFLVPRTYESSVSVFPLRQTQFADYLGLAQETGESPDDKAFPYTADSLFDEFLTYVRDPDRLVAVAAATGIVERGKLDDAAYRQTLRRFVSDIKFEYPEAQDLQAGRRFLNMQVRGSPQEKLTAFVQTALTGANKDMAHDLAKEVSQRAAELKNTLEAKVARLNLDIDARRKRVDTDRADEIVRVDEQSMIAHSLGMEKPFGLRAPEQGNTAPVQINTGYGQPAYLQGYAALDERIKILRDRKNNDPFINDLRQIQQDLYVTENDPRPARMLALLKQSPLADPETARIVRFSVESAAAMKIFPRLSVFGIGSLFLGLLLGSAMAFVRRARR